MLIESQGKLEKNQGKVREKSGNSASKIWQTLCIERQWKSTENLYTYLGIFGSFLHPVQGIRTIYPCQHVRVGQGALNKGWRKKPNA